MVINPLPGNAQTHTHTHIHTHKYTHTHIHTYTHTLNTHTHTHTPWLVPSLAEDSHNVKLVLVLDHSSSVCRWLRKPERLLHVLSQRWHWLGSSSWVGVAASPCFFMCSFRPPAEWHDLVQTGQIFVVGAGAVVCLCVCVCCLLYTSPSPRD